MFSSKRKQCSLDESGIGYQPKWAYIPSRVSEKFSLLYVDKPPVVKARLKIFRYDGWDNKVSPPEEDNR